MSKFPANDAKFAAVRALNLPLGHYAITSSGPLGIREVREIGDVDVAVSDELWQRLAAEYGVVVEDGISRVRISPVIEAVREESFPAPRTGPTVAEQIASVDLIDGLPFVNLSHILYFKRLTNRPKDQADIKAIEQLLAAIN